MNVLFISIGGIAAHVASVVLGQYAQWLLSKVLRQVGGHCSWLEDLRLFFEHLLRDLADGLCDRRSRHRLNGYEDDYQSGYFGSR